MPGVLRDLVVERLVVGTVPMERALGILRRLAQESAFEAGRADDLGRTGRAL